MSSPDRRRVSRALPALGLAGLLLLAPAACGFQPMYQGGYDGEGASATGSTNLAELSQVQIAPMRERLGQQLHNELRDLMNPNGQPGDPAYRLRIELDDSERETNLRDDAIATRIVRRLRARWQLEDAGTGRPVFAGTSRSFNSYDVVDQPYATLTAKRDAAERGVKQIARNIHARVAAYLARPRETAAAGE